MSQASEIYTADGVLLGRYYAENRSPVNYKMLPQHLINALIATEDVRYYDHHGVDFKSVVSIFYYAAKGDNRGGSTITQQLAKNLYKTRKDVSKGLLGSIPGFKTFISKTKEWITAFKLESNFDKKEILTLYFNTVDFGSNTFGIRTAAKTFYNTTPDSLSINQSAVLVGLLKAPTYYSPLANPKNSLMRRNTVLSQMEKYGFLKNEEKEAVSSEPLILDFHVDNPYDGPGVYFRGVMNNYLKEWGKKNGYDLYTDGLKIYTTIDSRLQKLAEESVAEHMRPLQKRFNNHWEGRNPWVDERNKEMPFFIDSLVKKSDYYKFIAKKYKDRPTMLTKLLNKKRRMKVFTWKGDKDTSFSMMDSIAYYKHFLHAGFMAMDPNTGYIKAWVGGINYKYFKFDHVKQAKRQPGSTFKPFVYAAAFEKGYSPCDRLRDEPITINYVENGENKSWSPHNADWEFTGDSMSLRHAMALSINAIAAKMTEKIGWNTVAEYARKCGIRTPIKAVPSICLGSNDVSLYELVGAYGTFMNYGEWIEPAFITKITDKNGKVLHTFVAHREKAISEETAFLMSYMLQGSIEEGGTSANLWTYDLWKHNNRMGGKTGTSSNHSDGWFVGVANGMVGGVWVGGEDRCIHFRTTDMGEGSQTALPIFGLFMEKVYADESLGFKQGPLPKPRVKINKTYMCNGGKPRHQKKADSTTVEVGDLEKIK